MRNTISDLNNYLFEQLERINDDSLSEEALNKELARASVATKIAETIIKNGELALRTVEHLNEYGYDAKVPAMLKAGD